MRKFLLNNNIPVGQDIILFVHLIYLNSHQSFFIAPQSIFLTLIEYCGGLDKL